MKKIERIVSISKEMLKSKKTYKPSEKPPTGSYIVVGPKGGLIKEKGHKHLIFKITNSKRSKLPPTPKPRQKYMRISHIIKANSPVHFVSIDNSITH